MPEIHITLEVCVASVHDACEAVEGGADRLELNSALELGGLTPSTGLLVEVQQAVTVPVMVMIRPRPAGFCYDDHERRTMLRDAETLLGQGADGVVFGVLDERARIDSVACRPFIELAGERETVFHRAVDIVPDVYAGVEQLIELGVTRVLTSGQARSAMEGADVIARLQQTCGDRIQILPAAGIGPENVLELLRRTDCRQVHGSFSRYQCDHAGAVGESTYRATDRNIVRDVRRALSQ